MRNMLSLFFCIFAAAISSCSNELSEHETGSEIVTIDPTKPSPIVEARESSKERRLRKKTELVEKYCGLDQDDDDARKRAFRNAMNCIPLGFQIVTESHPTDLLSLGMKEREVERVLTDNGFAFLRSSYMSVLVNGPECGDNSVNTTTYIREEKIDGADVFRIFYAKDGEVQIEDMCFYGLMSQNGFYLYEHERVSEKRINTDKFHLTDDETPESIQEKFYRHGWNKSRDSKPRCWGDMIKSINNGKDIFSIDFEKNESQKPTVRLRVRAKFLLDCEDKKNPKIVGFDDLEVSF